MPLPSAQDINPIPEDLDGKVAEENFLGKRLDEAVLLFRENSLYYQSDLMWMGPKAFCFYVHAAITYIKGEDAVGDSDMVNCFHSTLTVRLENDRNEIASVTDELKEVIQYILMNWSKYEVDPKIYGDLRAKYEDLLATL